ncbi:hypothetical protein FisN_3Lh529 [Fistulifera solaris]|uniref:Helicase-associated domain-containing protein n=1 Tax=Fistulifera solaris TaxID=1519565 RepID=A0A1Z5J8J6_FISSO|nr:hypothetical protein FisN_3Lh529 [Fistulifera solaris]|eukprot:GAX10323.1 hypothetical protein FisN_3Lh529 [Fistulifera solaris]
MDYSLSNENETQEMTTNDQPEVWLEATPSDQAWMEKFGRLVLFREAHGHCNVPKSSEDKELGTWVANQKSFHRAGTLRKDREKLLNEIDFSWTARARQDYSSSLTMQWMERYNQLVAFKAKHGHFQVTKNDISLKNWVSAQRLSYRSGTLHQERKDLLDQIGFVWNARNGRQKSVAPAPKLDLASVQNNEESWNQMFARLKEFYEQHGHTDVQANSDDLELLQWVSLQQNLHKLGHLNEKYKKALLEIGLSWKPQILQDNATENDRQMSPTLEDELWMSQFRLLREFRQQHGHTNVPRTGETSTLAQWWFVQQRLLERGRLSEDKKKQLADLLGAESSMKTTALNSSSTSREPQVASVNEGLTSAPVSSHAQASSMTAVIMGAVAEADPIKSVFVESSPGSVSSHAQLSPRAAASMEIEQARGHDMVSCAGDTGKNFPNATATINTADSSSEGPVVQLADHASKSRWIANATAVEASSEAMQSSNVDSDAPRIIQKFAIGTRIEKVFDVDGVLQVFGGNVYSFEQFEEEDGTHTWGYMIHYDDGDKEHMLETDVEKNLVVIKKQKRATKSHQNPKSSKRAKRTSPSSNDANSAPSAETTTPSTTNVAMASVVQDAGTSSVTTSTGTLKDPSKSSPSLETKKASKEKETGWVPRVKDARLLRQSGEGTKESLVVTVGKETVLANTKPMNDLENDSSSSEDEPLHLLVRKQARTGGKQDNQDNRSDGVDLEQMYLPDSPEVQTDLTSTNQAKDMQHELADKDQQLQLPVGQQNHSVSKHVIHEKVIQHELADKDQQLRLQVSQQNQSAAKNANQEKEIQHEFVKKDQQLRLQVSQQNQSAAKNANQEKEIQHEFVDKDQQLQLPVSQLQQSVAKNASREKVIQHELADKDQQLRLSVSQQNQCVAKNANKANRYEIVDLVDDDDDEEEEESKQSTIANSRQTSNETVNPTQKFPKGTTISRKFFDLSDNEQEKSYGGKVIDFVFLAQEKNWYYFIQYDDGDTEFMDEWEVAKFSASMRR